MIGVTSDMILKSVVLSLILGLISGGAKGVLHTFFILFKKLQKPEIPKNTTVRGNAVFGNLFDFWFTLVLGIIYVLILYVSTDGAFYFVSLVALFLGFVFAKSLSVFMLKLFKTPKSENMYNLRSF